MLIPAEKTFVECGIIVVGAKLKRIWREKTEQENLVFQVKQEKCERSGSKARLSGPAPPPPSTPLSTYNTSDWPLCVLCQCVLFGYRNNNTYI